MFKHRQINQGGTYIGHLGKSNYFLYTFQCTVNPTPAFKDLENKINLLTNTVPLRSTLSECSGVLPIADCGFSDDNTEWGLMMHLCSIDTIRASFAYDSYEWRQSMYKRIQDAHLFMRTEQQLWLSIALYPKQFQMVINSHRFELHIVPDATTWPRLRW